MIFHGSRYETARVVKVKLGVDPERFETALYPGRPSFGPVRVMPLIAVEGERFDLIAWKTLGNPLLWWMIAELNPEVFYPDEIPAGTILRIPVGSG